ncbi:MAG: ribosome recycling factor [Acidobacteriota bacterium]
MKEVLNSTESAMKSAVDATRHELASLRTGKANLSFLEPVRVDYYGSQVPLTQVANLSVPEARLIVIQPWDPKQIQVIEKAIMEANLGLTPSNDGQVIRVPVPSLTEERRLELCKKAREIGEKGKVSVRHARHEGRQGLEKLEKEKSISEDERDRGYTKVQEMHDKYVEEISESVSRKETDIMEV